MVNNRAKRVIIRAIAKNFSKDVYKTPDTAFYPLKSNEDATNNLIHSFTGLPIPEQVIESGVPDKTEPIHYIIREERDELARQKELDDFI